MRAAEGRPEWTFLNINLQDGQTAYPNLPPTLKVELILRAGAGDWHWRCRLHPLNRANDRL